MTVINAGGSRLVDMPFNALGKTLHKAGEGLNEFDLRENRQNLHVFNLRPVIYHTKKNSCGNPTPDTLSVEIYMSQ